MKFENNIKYFCMIRDLFQHMSLELVNKIGNRDNYMILIPNSRIRDIFSKSRMNYYEFEKLIQNIAQSLFEEGRYYLYIVVTKNKEEVTNINFYTKMPEVILNNQEKYSIKFKNDIKTMNFFKRKKLLHKLSKMNEFEIQDYKSKDELVYFTEKEKKDKFDFLKITKNIYIPGDTPEEVTTYYHNYRVIKTRIWQVKFVQYILRQLNKTLEKIFYEKDIVKYNGVRIEELDKYLEKLKENKVSMLELSNNITKLENI